MLKIPFATWIANAAVGLTGLYGDVTHQAKLADCSRQTVYDHARRSRPPSKPSTKAGRPGPSFSSRISTSAARMPDSGTGSP